MQGVNTESQGQKSKVQEKSTKGGSGLEKGHQINYEIVLGFLGELRASRMLGFTKNLNHEIFLSFTKLNYSYSEQGETEIWSEGNHCREVWECSYSADALSKELLLGQSERVVEYDRVGRFIKGQVSSK